MSFAALLDKVTGLLPKTFFLAAFIPVVVAAFLNCLILYIDQEWFRRLVDGKPNALEVSIGTIALVVMAYMLSSVSVFMQETLEGKHLLPERVGEKMRSVQQEKRNKIRESYQQARDNHNLIENARPEWREKLSSAAEESALAGKTIDPQTDVKAVRKQIVNLDLRRESARLPMPDELEEAVEALSKTLKEMSETDPDLVGVRQRLLSVIDYSWRAWDAKQADEGAKLRSMFGNGFIEPTQMGNVASSIQAYAMDRYGLSMKAFWIRMQIVLQEKKDYFGVLQDAKTQLDFLVACCWLVTLTWTGWLFVLPFISTKLWLYGIVALLGPISSLFFYGLAVTNYRTVADLITSGVDLYRFELLNTLHIATPAGLRNERAIWESLQTPNCTELSYEIPTKPS